MPQAPSEPACQAPAHLPFLPGRSLQGKDVWAVGPGHRGPQPLIPSFPCQFQTCYLPVQHPPSLQAHLLSVQPPGPPRQSHTANGAPTLSPAPPTLLGK